MSLTFLVRFLFFALFQVAGALYVEVLALRATIRAEIGLCIIAELFITYVAEVRTVRGPLDVIAARRSFGVQVHVDRALIMVENERVNIFDLLIRGILFNVRLVTAVGACQIDVAIDAFRRYFKIGVTRFSRAFPPDHTLRVRLKLVRWSHVILVMEQNVILPWSYVLRLSSRR